MKHGDAKRLSLGGVAAIAIALILGAMPWDSIAPTPVIVLMFILLIGGAIAIAIGMVWFITHPIKRSRA